jgi:hypothetical protein
MLLVAQALAGPMAKGIEERTGANAASFRRDLHKDLKAGRHAFPETICRHTTPLGTSNAL